MSPGTAAAQGAVKGVGATTAGWIGYLCVEGGAYGCAVGVFTAPIAAVLGALRGSVVEGRRSAPPYFSREAQARLARGDFAFLYQDVLRDTALDILREHGVAPDAFVPDDSGPSWPDEKRSYPAAAKKGAEQVLELAIIRVRVLPHEADTFILETQIRAALVDASSGVSVDSNLYIHRTVPARAADWLARGGIPVIEAVGEGVRETARTFVEDRWVLYTAPGVDNAPFGGVYTYGLHPVSPEIGRRPKLALKDLFNPPSASNTTWFGLGFSPVETLQPEFRWETFPRPGDIAAAGSRERFARVRYELRIYSVQPLPRTQSSLEYAPYHTTRMIYERKEIDAEAHRLATPLSPCTRYVWTVRARFVLDGRERWTEWSGSYFPDVLSPSESRQDPSPRVIRRHVDPKDMYFPFETRDSMGGNCH